MTFTQQNLNIVNDTFYVSSEFLVKSGMNKRTLDNRLSYFNTKKSYNFINFKDPVTKTKWIDFSSIPVLILRSLNLPEEKWAIKDYIKTKEEEILRDQTNEIWFILNGAWSAPFMWKAYIPYYTEYYLDAEKRNLFAKTHAVFHEIIQLKRNRVYTLKDIHKVYLKFRSAVFWTEDYAYFSKKICKSHENGIAETLVHNFKRIGRDNYKLSNLSKKLIIKYYSNPKKYSRRQITEMVNFDLIHRDLSPISYSTVTNYLRNPSVKNRCDLLRKGSKYSKENILPYLRRIGPNNPHDLLQVDTTRLNFPLRGEDGKIKYLFMCITMEVFTRRIIGYSFSESENHVMILKCLKHAFLNMKFIPKQIVVDNHSSFYSEEFKSFEQKLQLYGVHLRNSAPYNPKDKGHVERWFYSFSTYYLNRTIGSLGNGIRSKLVDNRASTDLERFYRQPESLKSEKQLIEIVSNYIEQYNLDKDPHNNIKKNPDRKLKFHKEDIANLFYKSKRLKVKRSMIRCTIGGNLLTYTILYQKHAESLNDTFIRIRYDADDPTRVYVFSLIEDKYLFFLKSDEPINILPSKKDLKKIKKHNEMINRRISSSFDRLVKEIDEGTNEINNLPIVTDVDPNEIKKCTIRDYEDNMLMAEMINKGDRLRTKRNKIIKKKKQFLSSNIYNSVTGKIKLIEQSDEK